jgi:hypothetical protein
MLSINALSVLEVLVPPPDVLEVTDQPDRHDLSDELPAYAYLSIRKYTFRVFALSYLSFDLFVRL